MHHNTTVFYYFYVHLIVNGIFYLLDSILFYIVDNNLGCLLRDVLVNSWLYLLFRLYCELQVGQCSIYIMLIYCNVSVQL